MSLVFGRCLELVFGVWSFNAPEDQTPAQRATDTPAKWMCGCLFDSFPDLELYFPNTFGDTF